MPHLTSFEPCPEEEGIKTSPGTGSSRRRTSNPALKKKGLRPRPGGGIPPPFDFEPCPEEEGIKTGRSPFLPEGVPLRTLP